MELIIGFVASFAYVAGCIVRANAITDAAHVIAQAIFQSQQEPQNVAPIPDSSTHTPSP